MSGVFVQAALLGVAVAVAGSGPSYEPRARAAHIQQALQAVAAMGAPDRHALEDYIDTMARTACRSSFHRLRLACLSRAAQKRCAQAASGDAVSRCAATADVVVTNVLGAGRLVSADERYDLMRHNRNYRRALRQALQQRYGGMAAALRLEMSPACAGEGKCLAQAIDRYCASHADARRLSWHYCTAALIWFIGTHTQP